MNKSETLDIFGDLVVQSVRDATFSQFEKIKDGKLRSKSAKLLHEKIANFKPEEMEALKSVVLDTIDSTLHHFLWLFEQNEEYDIVRYIEEKKKPVSLRDISDGLCGELYTEDGWIEKFSKYPPSIT